MSEIFINPNVYPFTRKGELMLRYGSFGNFIYKIESILRKNPEQPKYIYKKGNK